MWLLCRALLWGARAASLSFISSSLWFYFVWVSTCWPADQALYQKLAATSLNVISVNLSNDELFGDQNISVFDNMITLQTMDLMNNVGCKQPDPSCNYQNCNYHTFPKTPYIVFAVFLNIFMHILFIIRHLSCVQFMKFLITTTHKQEKEKIPKNILRKIVWKWCENRVTALKGRWHLLPSPTQCGFIGLVLNAY